MIRALLLRVAASWARRLPPEWARAAQSEAEQLCRTGELLRWTLGLARLALPRPHTWAGLLLAAGALAWLDARLDSGLTALAALLLVAAACGAATRRPVAAGVVVGLGIAAGDLVSVLTGADVPSGAPSTTLGALSLVVLVVPALLAAALGARLRGR